ncbi:MAG TPA: hypothetical protein VE093_15935 [Polyangiaceae bacterium]|jgi:hypothetical protein|nr:hypothetical protein [Polyangiaceae bacterium]
MDRRPSFCCCLAVAAILLTSGFARAEEPDLKAQKAAGDLYTQASHEMVTGDYAIACPRLEAARKILPQHVRTGMTLAQCYDEAGKPASAWAELQRVKPLAEAQGKADKVAEIEKKVADLEGRVSRLTIEVPAAIGALPGLVISRNGTPVAAAQWGKAEPVDPGTFEIGATALGKEPWSTRVDLKENGKGVVVSVAPPWPLPARVVERPPVEASKGAPPWMRTAGFVGMGVGAAGIGVGAVLGGMAISRNNASSDGHCDAQDRCDQAGFDLRTEARGLGNGSTAAFVVGGTLLAAGAVLFAIPYFGLRGREAARGRAQARFVVGPAGIGAKGVW